MSKMPPVIPDHFELVGGLDLETPAISKKPGKAIDAQNYEPVISGGYRRINGYERFDGHASPTAASYYILTVTVIGTIAVGNTITGAVSGATVKVLGVSGSTVVGGRLTGAFTSGEGLTIGGLPVGTLTAAVYANGEAQPSDHADYKLLAANDQRLNIAAVPGSGQILGVWVYNDVVYAFRNNAGGTAAAMYKSTASGWSAVSLGREITFNTGSAAVSEGQTLTGATSGASGVVTRVVLRSGSYGSSNAIGSFIFASVTGTFQNGENLQVGGVTKAVATSADTAIKLLPSGRFEFCNYNFTGSTSTLRMYGCDGVNNAFEFDGTVFVPIRTGMTTDAPSHIIGYKNYLFLSFLGSVQFSGIGAPYSWSPVLGAGEIATGDPITGFVPQGGTSSGSALAIFTSKRMHVLYGSASSDFKLQISNSDIGFSAYTTQIVGNNTFGLTARGIQAVLTTLTYGDFDYASISHLIQSLITLKIGLETASTTLRTKNQYRLYYSDGTALVVGLTGDKVNGILPLNYGRPVRCICTATLSNGTEVTYFGSDDGYIYQDNVGASFDGSAIEAWCRTAFNHNGSPRMRKKYRRAILEVDVEDYAQVSVTFDLGYGTSDISEAAPATAQSLVGGGGYWDQFIWDNFTWDAQIVLDPVIKIDGTQKNISLLFYSNRAQDLPHTVQGATLEYTPRRPER